MLIKSSLNLQTDLLLYEEISHEVFKRANWNKVVELYATIQYSWEEKTKIGI